MQGSVSIFSQTYHILSECLYFLTRTCSGPSGNFYELQLQYAGFSMDQCMDLKYPKNIAKKDRSFSLLQSGLNVTDIEKVFGCWLFIGQWQPDTSGKGKWFSPYVSNR